MPEGIGIVDLFLAPIRAYRACEELIYARIGHVEKGDQVGLGSRFLLHEEGKL